MVEFDAVRRALTKGGRKTLLVIGGFPWTGKTVFAEECAPNANFTHDDMDEVWAAIERGEHVIAVTTNDLSLIAGDLVAFGANTTHDYRVLYIDTGACRGWSL